MMSNEDIRQDLLKLRDIVSAHKAPDAPLAVGTAVIDGTELPVFTKVPNSLGEFYAIALEGANLPFLVYEQERYSFHESLEMARRMARVLLESYRLARGDRVAICARNCPEWCLAYMAITMAGGIVVPMNSWWRSQELEFGLSDSGSRLVFADLPRYQAIAPHLPRLEVDAILIKPCQDDPSSLPEFYTLLETVDPLSEEEIAELQIGPEHNASIMYTSGSTGEPKGVLSTHRAILSALYTWKFVKEVNEILRPELLEPNPEYQPALLANVPLFHVTGSHAQFLQCFLYHRKFVMMYKWDAETALDLIERERISILHGVPTMTWEVMQSKKFASTDLSSLRGIQSGGAPRPPEHLSQMLKMFPQKAQPGLGYGLTETNGLGAIIGGKFYIAKSDSTGRPTPPLTELKIVDDIGNILETGEAGEICIKGPSLMRGYWNNPEATAEVLKDGWFHTGDIGYLDTLGFLTITGRAKDIVIRGGENIACTEVEYALAEHAAVSEAAVYGIPDERLGEVPCATVMLKVGVSVSEAEIQAFLQDRIAAFKVPTRIHLQYDQLPRIATGKIAKMQLRQQTIDSL